MKKNTAITLIALIITIIVLLILAGVTLNMVMGDSGIFKKAQIAKEKTNQAVKNEEDNLNYIENLLNSEDISNGRGNESTIIPDFTPLVSNVYSYGFTIEIDIDAVCYDFLVNGEFKQAGQEKICKVDNLEANKEYKVIVVAIDSEGNSKKGIINVTTKKEILFTKSFLESGTINGNVVITENNKNQSAGLSITGASSNNPGNNDLTKVNRWYKSINLTEYNNLKFYAKKTVNHGSIYICVDNEWVDGIGYGTLSNNWQEYNIDLSNYQGEHVVSLVGGYSDNSGSSNSSSQYCDIRLNYISK